MTSGGGPQTAGGDGQPAGDRLGGDVDHAGRAGGVDVGELRGIGHGREPIGAVRREAFGRDGARPPPRRVLTAHRSGRRSLSSPTRRRGRWGGPGSGWVSTARTPVLPGAEPPVRRYGREATGCGDKKSINAVRAGQRSAARVASASSAKTAFDVEALRHAHPPEDRQRPLPVPPGLDRVDADEVFGKAGQSASLLVRVRDRVRRSCKPSAVSLQRLAGLIPVASRVRPRSFRATHCACRSPDVNGQLEGVPRAAAGPAFSSFSPRYATPEVVARLGLAVPVTGALEQRQRGQSGSALCL